jgi:general secretion pathway protein J
VSGNDTIGRSVDRDDAGFTLVELLVALALFSLLATLLFENVRFGLRAWRDGSAHTEQFQRAMVSQELLRRIIGNLYPMAVTNNGTRPEIDFEGTKETIGFLSETPAVMESGGRFYFKLLVEQHDGRADMVMTATPELARSQDTSATTKMPLLTDIAGLELSYFDNASADQKLRWNDNWTKRSDIPGLVRVNVTFRPGDSRTWPELVIAPRVRADVNCVYDPITMRCRGR